MHMPARLDPRPETAALQQLAAQLHRWARALADRGQDADDLVQQTLVTLLERAPEKLEHFGYARQVLVRLWLDRQRRLRYRLRRWWQLARVRPQAHVDRDAADVREQAARVRAAIAALPPRQRAVLVLRVLEELDYPTIARTLGISEQNVRSTLHVARTNVRRALGERP